MRAAPAHGPGFGESVPLGELNTALRPGTSQCDRHGRPADEDVPERRRVGIDQPGVSISIRYWVGTPIMVVTRRSRISCSTRPGWNERSRTTVAPVHHASSG